MFASVYDPLYEFNAPKFYDLEREMKKERGEDLEESFVSGEEWFQLHHP
jgi:hypothetical protein